MSVSIVKGQKTDVTKLHPELSQLNIVLGWQAPAALELDTSAFLLQQDGRVSSDNDLIFYGNPRNAFITYQENPAGPDQRQFQVTMSALPQSVHKIAVTLTIYNSDTGNYTFSQASGMYLRAVDGRTGAEIFRYNLDNHFSNETAIVIGEFYRYQSEWKFSAVGAGYFGGLKELCGSYGVDVEDTSSAAPSPSPPISSPPVQQAPVRQVPPSTPAPSSAPPAPAPQSAPLNLRKIELKKKGDVINLQKKAAGTLGELLINLNWNRVQKKGFFNRGSGGTDLDLGCLYELKDGTKGVVQALGNRFGHMDYEPYVALDADDRTGARAGGENMRINGNKIAQIQRILVFSFIYEGISRWTEADGVVTIYQKDGPDIIVRLDEHDNGKPMCAIAMIQNVGNETFSIERIVQYFAGHRQMDEAFRWGMRWTAGRK
ncbi:TerD family protein [Paenibacillus shenyangensis]|uniref:TerD family protein n=1 Tax=Paenibacillus sp. A9 TaxID=1284352 RepID=UPI00036A17ED|nr:TerD family protein [Paenibacillus sp. A9]